MSDFFSINRESHAHNELNVCEAKSLSDYYITEYVWYVKPQVINSCPRSTKWRPKPPTARFTQMSQSKRTAGNLVTAVMRSSYSPCHILFIALRILAKLLVET